MCTGTANGEGRRGNEKWVSELSEFIIIIIIIIIIIVIGAKGVVCGPGGARLADNRVPTKLRKCHLFLPSPIHARPRRGPWATS